MTARPRPCPRCHGGAVRIIARRGRHYGHCLACLHSGEERATAAEAITAWNAQKETR
jgi:hypothetical protein